MPSSHSSRFDEIDPRRVTIGLPDGVKQAFADLSAALYFSNHLSSEMGETLRDIAAGKPVTVDDFIGSFPLIAEQTFAHIHATGDMRAQAAWSEIASALLEHGFTLNKGRGSELPARP